MGVLCNKGTVTVLPPEPRTQQAFSISPGKRGLQPGARLVVNRAPSWSVLRAAAALSKDDTRGLLFAYILHTQDLLKGKVRVRRWYDLMCCTVG